MGDVGRVGNELFLWCSFATYQLSRLISKILFVVFPTHRTELLLGPTFATSKVLQHMNLQLSDIGVVEFHEAFAGTFVFFFVLSYVLS